MAVKTNTSPAVETIGTALLLPDLAAVMQTSTRSIKRKLAAGTFPIPPLRGIDGKLRWSPVHVRRYFETGRKVG